jgi:hypothetical protein
MSLLLALAGIYVGWRALHAAWNSLRDVPHSNDDLVFW